MSASVAILDLGMLDRLPPLPAAVLDLIQTLDSDGVPAPELARKISQDPALAVRVLKVVNSPFYGLPRQVASLAEAVIVLGMGTVRSLVVGASLMAHLPSAAQGSFQPQRMWEHSLYCGLSARLLARHVDVDPELAFTAGLLHDVGQLALYALQPGAYDEMRSRAAQDDPYLVDAARAALGIDHGGVGAQLVRRWRLPAAIEQAVARHHNPDLPPHDALSDLIHVADLIAHALAAGDPEGGKLAVEGCEAFGRLRLAFAVCASALETVAKENSAMRILLDR
jgi:putative nucleotidyltransferase with HDIG domain